MRDPVVWFSILAKHRMAWAATITLPELDEGTLPGRRSRRGKLRKPRGRSRVRLHVDSISMGADRGFSWLEPADSRGAMIRLSAKQPVGKVLRTLFHGLLAGGVCRLPDRGSMSRDPPVARQLWRVLPRVRRGLRPRRTCRRAALTAPGHDAVHDGTGRPSRPLRGCRAVDHGSGCRARARSPRSGAHQSHRQRPKELREGARFHHSPHPSSAADSRPSSERGS